MDLASTPENLPRQLVILARLLADLTLIGDQEPPPANELRKRLCQFSGHIQARLPRLMLRAILSTPSRKSHHLRTNGLTPLTAEKNNDNLLSTKGALASPWSFPGSVARAP